METNERSTNSCELGSALVAYLYDEATAPERERFESHLLECTACTDEFAELSYSRFSVFEWQREAFEPLATPRFVIPYPEPASTGIAGVLRAFLSLATPRFAAVAVLFAVVLGVGLWVSRSDSMDGSYTAFNSGKAAIFTNVPESVPVVASDEIPSVSADDNGSAVASNPGRQVTVKAGAVKPRPREDKPRVRRDSRVDRDQTMAITQKRDKPLPSLTGDADDEDDSLRLADLFEAVGNEL